MNQIQQSTGSHNKMSTAEPVLPRTANLLACKQWWRVCFLYGDQQKYYRQVYSKAAAQRLALSVQHKNYDNAKTKTASEEESLDGGGGGYCYSRCSSDTECNVAGGYHCSSTTGRCQL